MSNIDSNNNKARGSKSFDGRRLRELWISRVELQAGSSTLHHSQALQHNLRSTHHSSGSVNAHRVTGKDESTQRIDAPINIASTVSCQHDQHAHHTRTAPKSTSSSPQATTASTASSFPLQRFRRLVDDRSAVQCFDGEDARLQRKIDRLANLNFPSSSRPADAGSTSTNSKITHAASLPALDALREKQATATRNPFTLMLPANFQSPSALSVPQLCAMSPSSVQGGLCNAYRDGPLMAGSSSLSISSVSSSSSSSLSSPQLVMLQNLARSPRPIVTITNEGTTADESQRSLPAGDTQGDGGWEDGMPMGRCFDETDAIAARQAPSCRLLYMVMTASGLILLGAMLHSATHPTAVWSQLGPKHEVFFMKGNQASRMEMAWYDPFVKRSSDYFHNASRSFQEHALGKKIVDLVESITTHSTRAMLLQPRPPEVWILTSDCAISDQTQLNTEDAHGGPPPRLTTNSSAPAVVGSDMVPFCRTRRQILHVESVHGTTLTWKVVSTGMSGLFPNAHELIMDEGCSDGTMERDQDELLCERSEALSTCGDTFHALHGASAVSIAGSTFVAFTNWDDGIVEGVWSHHWSSCSSGSVHHLHRRSHYGLSNQVDSNSILQAPNAASPRSCGTHEGCTTAVSILGAANSFTKSARSCKQRAMSFDGDVLTSAFPWPLPPVKNDQERCTHTSTSETSGCVGHFDVHDLCRSSHDRDESLSFHAQQHCDETKPSQRCASHQDQRKWIHGDHGDDDQQRRRFQHGANGTTAILFEDAIQTIASQPDALWLAQTNFCKADHQPLTDEAPSIPSIQRSSPRSSSHQQVLAYQERTGLVENKPTVSTHHCHRPHRIHNATVQTSGRTDAGDEHESTYRINARHELNVTMTTAAAVDGHLILADCVPAASTATTNNWPPQQGTKCRDLRFRRSEPAQKWAGVDLKQAYSYREARFQWAPRIRAKQAERDTGTGIQVDKKVPSRSCSKNWMWLCGTKNGSNPRCDITYTNNFVNDVILKGLPRKGAYDL